MRLGTVIGRVTLSVRHRAYVGERLLVVLPWGAQTPTTGANHDYSVIVYDELGAGVGQTIAFSESSEAAKPFEKPTPVDAYCAALVDEWFHEATEPVRG